MNNTCRDVYILLFSKTFGEQEIQELTSVVQVLTDVLGYVLQSEFRVDQLAKGLPRRQGLVVRPVFEVAFDVNPQGGDDAHNSWKGFRLAGDLNDGLLEVIEAVVVGRGDRHALWMQQHTQRLQMQKMLELLGQSRGDLRPRFDFPNFVLDLE